MSVFAGILSGLADAHHEHNQELIANEIQRRKGLGDFWLSQVNAPDVRPEAKDIATQKYLGIMQTPFDKKLPKQLEGLDDYLNVSPKVGQSVQAPPPAQAPQPKPGPMSGPAAPPVAPPFISQDTLNQPQNALPPRYTFDEQLQRQQRQVQGEEHAKLMATYGDPGIVRAMVNLKQAEQRPEIVPPGSGVMVPKPEGGWDMSGAITPRIKPPEENLQNAAVLNTLKKQGKLGSIQFNETLPYLQQIPATMQADAVQEFERLKKTPDPQLELIRAQMMQNRSLEQASLNQRIKEFETLHGPEAMEAYRSLIKDNPDSIGNLSPEIRAQVAAYMKQKGDRVPRTIPGQMQETAFNADQTLARIYRSRELINANPDLIGPVMGALAHGQSVSGLQLMRDPAKAKAAQDLLASLMFLQTSEAKAILGSRPAFAWADKFAQATANPNQQMPIIQGALESQEAHARMIKDGIDEQRYGTQPGGAGSTVPPPSPMPGGGGGQPQRTPNTKRTAAAPGMLTSRGTQAPPPSPAPGQSAKVATMMDVRAYAQSYHISESQARQVFIKDGFQIPGGQ